MQSIAKADIPEDPRTVEQVIRDEISYTERSIELSVDPDKKTAHQTHLDELKADLGNLATEQSQKERGAIDELAERRARREEERMRDQTDPWVADASGNRMRQSELAMLNGAGENGSSAGRVS